MVQAHPTPINVKGCLGGTEVGAASDMGISGFAQDVSDSSMENVLTVGMVDQVPVRTSVQVDPKHTSLTEDKSNNGRSLDICAQKLASSEPGNSLTPRYRKAPAVNTACDSIDELEKHSRTFTPAQYFRLTHVLYYCAWLPLVLLINLPLLVLEIVAYEHEWPEKERLTLFSSLTASLLTVLIVLPNFVFALKNANKPILKARGKYVVIHLAIACLFGIVVQFVEHMVDMEIISTGDAGGGFEIAHILGSMTLANLFIAITARQRIIYLIFRNDCQTLKANEYLKTALLMQIPWIITATIATVAFIVVMRITATAYVLTSLACTLALLIFETLCLGYYTYCSRAVSLKFSDWRHNLRLCASSILLVLVVCILDIVYRDEKWVEALPQYMYNILVGLYVMDAFTLTNIIVVKGWNLQFDPIHNVPDQLVAGPRSIHMNLISDKGVELVVASVTAPVSV
ncbi:hypothetical protein SARC_04370 [Sphaeroforma arctica JP610]|uniref:Uncharacterized protein n=1 Tax=Sphaeroforma arctica JP610 TaxID=667725 RepID=A0A0L0G544_9EUKA|nr:hypothetical protein SARC_04370 [Sphaeroforma arctica JP610]KNC83383.1 hypothetical protein SARC_04370 [Sphaeroforma arctica JP610]|eukprot:XP_014157285.1 hypothetical protein SARC_04370 [Sphaeroforma arctica JP610]